MPPQIYLQAHLMEASVEVPSFQKTPVCVKLTKDNKLTHVLFTSEMDMTYWLVVIERQNHALEQGTKLHRAPPLGSCGWEVLLTLKSLHFLL